MLDTSGQFPLPGFGPAPEPEFVVFHDESGTYGGKEERWLFHGMLILPSSKVSAVARELLEVRQKENFYDEVHFVDLGKSLQAPKTKCAKGWMDIFRSLVLNSGYYYCLAVDTNSPEFQAHRFPQPYIAYNYFARVTLVSAFSWFFKATPQLSFRVVSDYKHRHVNDNFCTYLPRAVVSAIEAKRLLKPGRYPILRSSVPRVDALHNAYRNLVGLDLQNALEILQLSDLITSGIAQAIKSSSSLRAKQMVGNFLSGVLEDARREPWLQTQAWHRRLSVSAFPSAMGQFFDPNLEITNRNQEKLPF